MTISPGTRLGPYEIVAPIGAGGMGEVYKARDTRLDRSVAVKILAADLADNAQFKARFKREAKTISQLSHPHICTLYDVGENYLVMELLDGETLADRIAKSPLTLADVLKYGAQIAEGLGKAHREGVIHRDLKPGNIMITKSGAKLLDFGLAKGAPSPSSVPEATIQKPLTQEGTVLGTFQYMAPEQLAGEEPDPRTDIFAFGAVLYEMATGKRAFEGKTKTSLIAAIVSSEPKPISSLQPLTPPSLEHIIRKCLSKERDDRWQSASDIAEELRWIGQEQPPAPKRRYSLGGYAALLALVLAGGVFAGYYLVKQRAAPPMTVTEITTREHAIFDFESSAPILSPEGSRVAFVAKPSDGPPLLWIRRLDSSIAQQLKGTENAAFPFWSPDGKSICFFADGRLKRIESAGGAPEILATALSARGGAWNKDGVIIFTPGAAAGLFAVSSSGGEARPLTSLDYAHGQQSHRYPAFLPDGRRFLAYIQGVPEGNNILLGSLDSKETRDILRSDAGVVFAPPDKILLVRNGALRAQRLNMRTFEPVGESFSVAEAVQTSSTLGYAAVSASDNGSIAYVRGTGATLTQLKFLDAHGAEVGTAGQPADQLDARLAPDGHAVAVTRFDSGGIGHIWSYDFRRRVEETISATSSWSPVWSPDGKSIVYTSFSGSPGDLFVRRIDHPSSELLLADGWRKIASDWSADGRYIIYHILPPGRPLNIEAYSIPDKKIIPLVEGPSGGLNGHLSPDQKWLAYSSSASGTMEVYVQSFPMATQKFQISGGGGAMPAWSKDGHELYFWQGPKLMATTIHTDHGFVADAPRPLFEARMRSFLGVSRNQYDVTPDGRFLVNVNVSEQANQTITLVQNWTGKPAAQ
jgi:serine/threonine protein kinase